MGYMYGMQEVLTPCFNGQKVPMTAMMAIVSYLLGPYRDRYQCETNVMFAALLMCNTNVSPLGGKIQAANAMFYLNKYLSKNPVKPAHFVTCITAARRSAQRNTSVADDAGTDVRNAVFLLEKVLCRMNALAEVADTQGAMLLLGHPSSVSSHPFAFCFVAIAMEYQLQLCATAMQNTVVDDMSDTGKMTDTISVSSNSNWSHPSTASSVSLRPEGATHSEVGGAVLFTDHAGEVHALSQHHHYRWRCADWDATIRGVVPTLRWWHDNARGTIHGDWQAWDRLRGLESLSLLMYARHIQIVPMPSKRELATARVRYYIFHEDHPLHKSHIQRLAAKHSVAILSKPPTPPRETEPPNNPSKRAEWHRKAGVWALYIGTTMCPWDRDGFCGVTSYVDLQVQDVARGVTCYTIFTHDSTCHCSIPPTVPTWSPTPPLLADIALD